MIVGREKEQQELLEWMGNGPQGEGHRTHRLR